MTDTRPDVVVDDDADTGVGKHLGWALVLISIAQLMVVLDATIERVVDHVILPAVQHPSCGTQHTTPQGRTDLRNTDQGNHKLTKNKARKTT